MVARRSVGYDGSRNVAAGEKKLSRGTCRDRRFHVVADGAYLCTALRHLPANVTLTGPLPRHAALCEVHPDVDDPLRCAAGAADPAAAARRSAAPTRSPPPRRPDRPR